ncbi:MAG: F0F1 ATP synthase subunit B [Firmicutes bacterium]|nr:F0F1 ATP synthase subunit B [Bacillota bacterium]
MPVLTVMPVSVNPWTFIFQAINVLIVLGVLYKMLFKPLGAIIQKREADVANSISKASSAREEAEKLLAEYREKLGGASEEARALLEQAVRRAEEARQKMTAEAKQDAVRTLDKARQEIALERDRAISVIRDEMADLAVAAARKVVERELSDEDHARMVREFVGRVGDLQ